MTLAIAWTRRIRDCEELIVCSDSRLSGGRNIDCGQKILPLPRSDSFICCAGETDFTYPLTHLASSAISDYERARDRSLDILDLKGHITRVLTEALSHITSPLPAMRCPSANTEFLFGGYSWVNKRFFIWRIKYSPADGRFVAYNSSSWFSGRTQICIGGDWKPTATKRLVQHLHEKFHAWPQSDVAVTLNWEPFEILRDLLRENVDGQDSSIGGPPQIVKIYQHLNSKAIGVYWPNRASGRVAIAGRSPLGYEKPACWILDPDSLRTSHPYFSERDDNEYEASGTLNS
jgi:hypothetical protein